MLKIFHAPGARSLRVIWMAEEIGLDYEIVPETFGQPSADFLSINPAKGLPAIVDGDVVMSESVAIMLYLAEGSPLLHADAYYSMNDTP